MLKMSEIGPSAEPVESSSHHWSYPHNVTWLLVSALERITSSPEVRLLRWGDLNASRSLVGLMGVSLFPGRRSAVWQVGWRWRPTETSRLRTPPCWQLRTSLSAAKSWESRLCTSSWGPLEETGKHTCPVLRTRFLRTDQKSDLVFVAPLNFCCFQAEESRLTWDQVTKHEKRWCRQRPEHNLTGRFCLSLWNLWSQLCLVQSL